jgi:mono/diheme cytochrome c family protein
MKTPLIVLVSLVLFFTAACSSRQNTEQMKTTSTSAPLKTPVGIHDQIADGKGIGEVKNVTLNNPLDEDRVKRGLAIYEMKCSSCHKLDDKRVVGPGFLGVTKARKPEWIMNMITNPEAMLDNDPVAQELLELCLTRMPNQNVGIGDARDILEFLRKNDGEI